MTISILCFLLLLSSQGPSLAVGGRGWWTQHNGMRWGPGYNSPFHFLARLPGLYRTPETVDSARWQELWKGQ